MTTKFDVGDRVAIIGEVKWIGIDDDGVEYRIAIKNDSRVFTESFTEEQLYKKSGCIYWR